MQFRQFFLFVIFGIALLSTEQALAQKIMTNENGEKIIVYPDGSWKYFNTTEQETKETPVAEPEKTKAELKAERKQQRMQEKLAKEQMEGEAKKRKKRAKKEASAIANANIQDEVDSEARQEAIRQAEMAAAAETTAEQELEDASLKLAAFEEELKEANDFPDTTEEELLQLKKQVERAKEEEKIAKVKLKTSRKRARQMEKMINMSPDKREKLMAKMEGTAVETSPAPTRKRQKGNEVFADEAFKSTETYIAPKKTFAVYKRENDVMYTPPQPPCELTFDGVDEFSGKSRRDVARQNLFVHTSDQLRPYLKGREYITCNAYLSAISGGYKLLYLHFDILSESAQREFGALEKGSILSIKFIDGSTIKLSNSKTDRGIPNSLEKSVSYRGQYIISAASEKVLRKKEVDKVRVVWGTGYEDYEVYDLDFFVHQFNCLNAN